MRHIGDGFDAFNRLLIKQLMYAFATTYDSLLAVAMSRALFFSSSFGGHLSAGPNLPIVDHSLYVAIRQRQCVAWEMGSPMHTSTDRYSL
jgi:hypothetical protein